VTLLSNVANVRILEDRPEDALQLYRRVLELTPGDRLRVTALNNLATLAAEQPQRLGEAMKTIEQAIAIAGPQPGLLDTKAMILVYDGKAKEGVGLLEDAVRESHDPRYRFHLAVACFRMGDEPRARQAFKDSKEAMLTQQVLTRMDRKMLAELDRKLTN
jgi:tetratricopeptide (TPR) repeat protein